MKTTYSFDASKVTDKVNRGMADFLQIGSDIVAGRCRREAPVDTGHLRSSVYNRVESAKAFIFATAHYAIFVELGVARRGANPFMTRGLKTSAQDIRNLLRQIKFN